jgi:high-affinity Fe2+/Pb2+ permease
MKDWLKNVLMIMGYLLIVALLIAYLLFWWGSCGNLTISEAPVWCISR